MDISLAGLGDIALLVLDLTLLLDVEAEVLEEDDLAVLGGSADSLDLLTDAVVEELDILVEEGRELLGDGGQAILFNLLAVRATEMAHQDDRGGTYELGRK